MFGASAQHLDHALQNRVIEPVGAGVVHGLTQYGR